MLKFVEVITSQGNVLTLTLADPSNGYLVKNIEGLDPTKATLVSSSFAALDGGQYHSSRREPRNIKFSIEFKPDYVSTTVQDLRRNLYLYFMPKSLVRYRFHTDDGLYYDIEARVESFETALFSKQPAVEISTMCFDPDFLDPNPVLLNGLSVNNITYTTIDYVGSVDSGIELNLAVNRDLPSFSIYHIPPDGTIRSMDFVIPLVAGDKLKLVTMVGLKKVLLTRAAVETSVLFGLAATSDWVQLQPGDNNFRVYAPGAAVPYSLSYFNKYGGL